jgi:hypothetical protein
MKKTFFTASAVLLMVINCFGQSVTKTDYLKKSKNQKTAAFVLLGVGAALDIGGIIATISNANKEIDNLFSENSVNHGTEYALYIAGTASLLGSLPLFIVSKSNKKKALSLGINTQQFHQLKKSSLYAVNYPTLSVKIKF